MGNPGLESERALGVDLSLRWRTPRASGEVTYFRNDISDYIFRRNMDHEEFEERGSTSSSTRFGGREPAGHEDTKARTAAKRRRRSSRSSSSSAPMPLLQGIESHADFQLTSTLSAEAGLDFVRGVAEAGRSAAAAHPAAEVPRRPSLSAQRAADWRAGRSPRPSRIACRRTKRRPTATRC